MGVIAVTEEHENRTADVSTKAAAAKRIFKVTFDSNDDPENRPLLARFASYGGTSVPALYSMHPYSPWLIVTDILAKAIGPFDFMVEAHYNTPQRKEDESTPSGEPDFNPLTQPWEVEWDFEETTEPIDTDIDGKPIQNSAGEDYDPPVQRSFSDLVLRISRNEATFDPLFAAKYKDAVNSDVFYGFEPGFARLKTFAAARAKAGDLFYWKVRYEVVFRTANFGSTDDEIKKLGWKVRLLDRGFRYWTGEFISKTILGKVVQFAKFENFKDANDNEMAKPMHLDGEGKPASWIKNSDNKAEVTAHWDKYKIYKELPFADLKLNQGA